MAKMLSSYFESSGWKRAKGEFPVFLGVDANGEAITEDLVELGHLLIAGGDSRLDRAICRDAVLFSLMSLQAPERLQVLVADTEKMVPEKKLALSPHLKMPVCIEASDGRTMVEEACEEFFRRKKLFQSKKGKTSFTAAYPKQPRMVVFLGDLKDLMDKESESRIALLGQQGSFYGIHLVCSAQTGRRKHFSRIATANLSSKLVLKARDIWDSKAFIGTKDAKDLAGHAAFLFQRKGAVVPFRGRGVEIINGSEKGELRADLEKFALSEGALRRLADPSYVSKEEEGMDEKCVMVVRDARKGSVSLIQRRCLLGYGQAECLMNLMENRGIVGPEDGKAPRQVISYEE